MRPFQRDAASLERVYSLMHVGRDAVVDAGLGARYVRAAETFQSDIHERVCGLMCVWAQRMNESRAETFTSAAAAAWQEGKLDKMPDSSRRDIWR